MADSGTPEEVGVVITGKDESSSAFSSAANNAKQFEGGIQDLGAELVKMTPLAWGITEVLGKMKEGLQFVFEKTMEANQTDVLFEQALRNVGAASGITESSLASLNEELARNTVYMDDDIKSAETIMMRFTQVGKNIFPEAMRAAANMAAVMKSDIPSAAQSIGMSLERPEQAMRRLRMMGVDLTDSQRAQINTLVDLGQKEEAQKIILTELNKSIGDSAQAIHDSDFGAWQLFKRTVEETAEALGKMLTPKSQSVKDSVREAVDVKALESMGVSIDNARKKLADWYASGDAQANNPGFGKAQAAYIKQLEAGYDRAKATHDKFMAEDAAKSAQIEQMRIDKQKALDDEAARNKRTAALDIEKQLADINLEGLEKELKNEDIRYEQEILKKEASGKSLEGLEEIHQAAMTQIKAKWTKKDINDAQALHLKNIADDNKQWLEKQKLNHEYYAIIAEEQQQVYDLSLQADTEYATQSLELVQAAIQSIVSGSGKLMVDIFNDTKNFGKDLQEFFGSVANSILQKLGEMLAEAALFEILMAGFNMFGGAGGMAEGLLGLAGGLFHFQTPEGGSRLVPGAPNIPQLAVVHGGETVSRGGGDGGIHLYISGDYLESEEANARLFDRIYKYQRRNGLAFG